MIMGERWAHDHEVVMDEEESNGHSWTFPALVGAFVDLFVAHLLLLAAVATFFASRLLSFFGLRLPTFCLASTFPPLNWCLCSVLSRGPHRLRLASLHSALASRPPFHACPSCLALRLALEESSRGSVERAPPLLLRGGDDSDGDGSSSFDIVERRKGLKWRRRKGRRRERATSSGEIERRKGLLGVTPLLGWQEGCGSIESSDSPSPEGASEEDYGSVRSSVNPSLQGIGESFGSSSLHLVEQSTSDDAVVGTGAINKENLQDHCTSSEEMIKALKKALEGERCARAALRLELEKERNASATAADEAMAMIERLQSEKASINMDAKQFQRMIEGKAAYDQEEMELLKEIIVRREQELLVMGKELEMYRQIMLSVGEERHQEFDGHPAKVILSGYEQSLSMEPSRVCQSTEMREEVKGDYGSTSRDPSILENSRRSYDHGKELTEGSVFQQNHSLGDIRKHSVHFDVNTSVSEDNLYFQEKSILPVDVCRSGVPSENSGGVDTLSSCGVDKGRHHEFKEEMLLAADTRQCYSGIQNAPEHVGAMEKSTLEEGSRGVHPCISCTETDPSSFDVHVIDDNDTGSRQEDSKDDASCSDRDLVFSQDSHLSFEMDGIGNVDIPSDNSYRGSNAEEPHVERSRSDAPRASSLSRLASIESKRSSMSAVDDERSKLETEVEDLRRRLKIVQQGKQKLNFSVENMEKESFHLQLLDEIALQLRDIKQLTHPDKSIHWTSPTLPSPQANTKEK